MLPNIKAYLNFKYIIISSVARQAGLSLTILESKIVPRRLKTFFAYAVRNAKAKNSCASAHASQCSVVRCTDRPSIIFLICKP